MSGRVVQLSIALLAWTALGQGAPRLDRLKLVDAMRKHLKDSKVSPLGVGLEAFDPYTTVGQPAPRELIPGEALTISIQPLTSPVLETGFFVRIPAGAQRVEVGVDLTTENVDIDLFGRFDQQVLPSGSVPIADVSSTNPVGEDESIVLTPRSQPAIRPGQLFIALGLRTLGRTFQFQITVIVDGSGPLSPCGFELTSGTPRPFQLAAAGEIQSVFDSLIDCIEVPAGATSLTLRLDGTPSTADFALTIWSNRDILVGEFDPDFFVGSENPAVVEINAQSDPPLEPGRYFIISLLTSTNVPAQGALTATVGGATGGGGGGPSAGGLTTVSAAGFGGNGSVARNMILASFGQGLAARTEGASTLPLPIQLAGSTVQVVDSRGGEGYAGMFFGTSGQINWLFPDWSALGPAKLTVRNENGQESVGVVEVRPAVPSLFAVNPDGSGPPFGQLIHVSASGVQTPRELFRCGTAPLSCVPTPIDIGAAGDNVVLVLYGTGFRDATNITAIAGGQDLSVLGAVAQGQFAGLDQANVILAETLRGRGDVAVSISGDDSLAELRDQGPVAIVRRSNEVIINVGPPPFTIERSTPDVVPAGSKLSGFLINGQGLGSASAVEFAPPQGIEVAGFRAVSSQVVMDLSIALDAVVGQRMMSVISPRGRSNWIPFEVSPPAQPPPTIRSLSATEVAQGQTIAGFVLSGQELADAFQVRADPAAGITFSNLRADQTRVTVDLRVAADAPAGQRLISVLTPRGESNALTLLVRLGCTYSLSNSNISVDAAGETRTVSVQAPNGCAWQVSGEPSWITIVAGGSGSGNGTIRLTIAPNTSSSPRSASIQVATETLRVTQSGGAPPTTSTSFGVDLPAVDVTTLFTDNTWFFDVPAGATRLAVRLATNTSGVDLDLYVRFGSAPTLTSGGQPIADYKSESLSGSESITVRSSALRTGRYYFAVGQFTLNRAATGSVTGTIEF